MNEWKRWCGLEEREESPYLNDFLHLRGNEVLASIILQLVAVYKN